VLLLVASASVGCEDLVQTASPFPEKQARCDLRPTEPQCTDIRKFTGPSLATFEGVCNSLRNSKPGATGYQEAEVCPSTEMWGGCQTKNGDGSLQTNWFYKGDKFKTEADAQAECDDATWVPPP
jgi:hypothetical protein